MDHETEPIPTADPDFDLKNRPLADLRIMYQTLVEGLATKMQSFGPKEKRLFGREDPGNVHVVGGIILKTIDQDLVEFKDLLNEISRRREEGLL